MKRVMVVLMLVLAGCHPHAVNTAPAFVCQMEPSDTVEGFEIMAYYDAEGMNPAGFRVPCPFQYGGQ